MARIDAKTERWTPMEICGVQGYFNDMRIIRESIPKDMNFCVNKKNRMKL